MTDNDAGVSRGRGQPGRAGVSRAGGGPSARERAAVNADARVASRRYARNPSECAVLRRIGLVEAAGTGFFACGVQRWRPRGKAEVPQDPGDDPALDDRGDEARATDGGRTLEDVDQEDALLELHPREAATAGEVVGVRSQCGSRATVRRRRWVVWPRRLGDAGTGGCAATPTCGGARAQQGSRIFEA